MDFINGYSLYQNEPNTIAPNARVYFKTFHFETNNPFKERIVRVYIPSTYDFSNPEKRFPVLYMFDGKNLFDDYTSFTGEWHVDESIEDLISRGLTDGVIVVGIDAPNKNIDRTLEMTPSGLENIFDVLPEIGYAHLLADFVFNKVKEDIDSTFYTLSEKEHTGVGGSSMGGLISFYIGIQHKEQIDYCLNFSPAFFLFKWKSFEKFLDDNYSTELPNQYFFVGGVGFEAQFVKATFKTHQYFLDHGFNKHMAMIHDENKEHNEVAWGEYFEDAISEMSDDIKKE